MTAAPEPRGPTPPAPRPAERSAPTVGRRFIHDVQVPRWPGAEERVAVYGEVTEVTPTHVGYVLFGQNGRRRAARTTREDFARRVCGRWMEADDRWRER